MLSAIMRNHFRSLMHHQKGDTQVEEGEQLSESDDVYSLPDVTYRRAFNWTELVSRIISGLMFVAGALMLLAAGYVNQSDRDCRAQLSMWSPVLEAVEYEERDWVSIFSTHSEFVGTPTIEMEEKWHKLVDNMLSSSSKQSI